MPFGVYVSRCRGRLGVLDADALAAQRPDATVSVVVEDLFDPDVQEAIMSDVLAHGLDAVVLAGNSTEHFTHSLSGRYLRRRIAEAGVSPNRIVSANLLEQVALAHAGDEDAMLKARAVLDVAVLEATGSPELEHVESVPDRSVLVLGATTEGLVAAQRLLELGYSVVVADRGDGSARVRSANVHAATGAYVLGHPNGRFVDDARITDGLGWLGDFDITVESGGTPETLHVGGLLLAEPHRVEWVRELRPHFRVDVDDEGHARAIDPSTHPAETVDPGIMVVPLRSSDAPTRDKVASADSAAMALVLRLSQPSAIHYRQTSSVDETICGGCASCVKTCAFGACTLGEDGMSHVDLRRCRACGKCVVSCPVGARDIVTSPHDYLIGAIRAYAASSFTEPKVLGFLCGGCGYPAADRAGAEGYEYPASFLPLRIPCGGRLDTLYVLEAFKEGFRGVSVFRCREGHCHNLVGNLDMDRRLNLLRVVLRSRGIDDARLRIVDISPSDGEGFAAAVNELYEHLSAPAMAEGGAR